MFNNISNRLYKFSHYLNKIKSRSKGRLGVKMLAKHFHLMPMMMALDVDNLLPSRVYRLASSPLGRSGNGNYWQRLGSFVQ